LRELWLGGNQLTTLDLSANTDLVNVDVSHNALGALNIDALAALEFLGINENPLGAAAHAYLRGIERDGLVINLSPLPLDISAFPDPAFAACVQESAAELGATSAEEGGRGDCVG